MHKDKPVKVVFHKEFTEEILKSLGNEIETKSGRIIDRVTKTPVLTQEGFDLTIKELGAIKIGSQIFFKNDVVSLLKLYESSENNGVSNT